jgi:CRISPR-associated protein Cas5t
MSAPAVRENADTLRALRVVAEGPVTSFRYPYFAQGVQPTYPIPPPATVYGHVCSALGGQPPPDTFRMALHFTVAGHFTDYEHTHLFGQEPKLSPFKRDLLFRPRLTLYLDRPDWLDAFRAPRYVVTLGRSQDLMAYRAVEIVTLRRADAAYAEHTLLPLDGPARVENMVALTLPRYLTPARQVTWGQYALIRERRLARLSGPAWIDPDTSEWRGARRGVFWIAFR